MSGKTTHPARIDTEYLAQLIEMLSHQGIHSSHLVMGTGLMASTLTSSREKISPLQYHQIIDNALRLTNNPLLGLEHGKRMNIHSHGFLGLTMMAAETLGDALSLVVRYARSQTLMADIRFVQEDDSAIIQINRLAALPDTFDFVVQNILSTLVTIVRFLIQQHEELTAMVKLTSAAQRPEFCYEDVLDVPFMFEQPHNQLCIPTYLLDSAVSTANIRARRNAKAECLALLDELDKGQDLVSRIRRQLQQSEAYPTLMVMAKCLDSSPRTLNRQLAQLNTSYQQVIDESRCERAMTWLSAPDYSVDDIAHRLGYNDPSNFGRAFRRWLGMSPREFRKKTKEQTDQFVPEL
ncbi:AraC family transcriptional regulator ligand-binding domain-containing protein [Bacterioplanoides sp.]|uniref:AraC family transcriptional regulator n=1 Tax=Bacterioplanoides sp. TaxID=2066072 RepID=UPI003AFFB5DB